jgi:hypothetical protein
MRLGIRELACVVLALWASPASAQPLFHSERDWTIEVSGQLYGFRGVVQTPGEFWWTQVWIGGRRFEPARVPADRWVVTVPPVAAVLAVRYVTRPVERWCRP